MKKLLIALSTIAMLVAGATVASAAGGYVVDYNEELSVAGEKAVIDVYLDATSDEGFASFACQSAIYNGTTNVTKSYVSSVACTPYGNLTSAQVKYTNGVLIVQGNGSAAEPLLTGENGQLARFELTLSQALTEDLVIKAARATAYAPITNGAAGAKVTTTTLDEYDTIKVAPAEPTVETVAATSVALAAPGENEVAGTDVAAAYKASYNFVSGQTAAWTATGKVDYPINLANISGPTDLGLIVTDAAVSGVALKVTTPAN